MATKKTASTAVATRAATGVVSVQDMLKSQLAKLKDKTGNTGGGNNIRVTQDKQFQLPDGTVTPGPLQLIVVDFNSQNFFYPGRYVKGQVNPPVCFAISESPRGMVPSDNSLDKQSEGCDDCPMNQFGSSENGEGKACKNSRVLAVLPPDADDSTPMWLLRTSPTATKTWDAYAKSVERMFGVPPAGVITEVSFDPNQTYATLTFGEPQPHNNTSAVNGARLQEAAALLAEEPDVTVQPAAAAKPVKAAPRRPVATARR